MMTASQLVTLKSSVDKEMKRRCYNGSMTAYAGSSYAFQTAPAAGGVIQARQGNAVIQPLNAVNPISGLSTAAAGEVIPTTFDNDKLAKVVNDLSNMTTTTSNPGCAASCSGLCHTQCSTSCTGCSGCSSCSSCTGTCSACSNGCSTCTSCTNSCATGCANTCATVCDNGCRGCSGSCTGGCYGTCWDSCSGCGGCTGSQNTSRGPGCGNYCTGTCVSSCGACTGCTGSHSVHNAH